MIIARQSTAKTFMVGPVLDADGVAVTDCVIADFKVSKNGAAPAAFDASATLTHRHSGHYSLAATATDLNTVGSAQVTIDDTVNACQPKDITVIEEAVFDLSFAAAAAGPATAADALAIKAVTDLLPDGGALTQIGTDAGVAATEATGANVAATAAQTAGEAVQDVLADLTEDDGGTPRFTTNALEQSQIAAAAALAAYDPPTHAELTSGLAAADDAVLAAIAALNNLSSAQAQTAAAAALTAYDPPTHAELTAGLAAADDAVLAAIAALNNLSAAAVNAEVDQAIADAALATAASLSTAQTAITAIKAKTDSLTFTQAGHVDANIQRVNDVALLGVGTTGDRWRPA
jgi:hypothetical protein